MRSWGVNFWLAAAIAALHLGIAVVGARFGIRCWLAVFFAAFYTLFAFVLARSSRL